MVATLTTGNPQPGSILLVAGGAISWISKQQTLVALSTMEVEFVVASKTRRELCWLHNFLSNISFPQLTPMILNIVALSTMEAEFVAASKTKRELCWLCNFLSNISSPQSTLMILNINNQSAISVSKQPEHMGHLKHLDCKGNL